MAVFISQRDMLREFLALVGDRSYTIEEAYAWSTARQDPEFWKEAQDKRFLYSGRCEFLRKELHDLEEEMIREMERQAPDAAVEERAETRTAIGPRLKRRHAIARQSDDGSTRHEHVESLNLTVEEGSIKIQEYLDLGKGYFKKARELFDTLSLQLPKKDVRKLQERFKNNKLWQQCMTWEEEDLVG